MERTLHMDCGDGIRRANNGAHAVDLAIKTAAYTATASDTGKTYSNKGAGGSVYITLPKPKKNMYFSLLKQANQTFGFQATNGAKINGGTANKKYENTANELTAFVRIFSDGTDWFLAATPIGTFANNNT